jgi:DNA repair and recombination RAD54-like protein
MLSMLSATLTVAQALRKKLLARKIFVPWGSNKPFTPLKLTPPPAAADAAAAAAALQQELLAAAAAAAAEDAALPPGIEPLVLWDPAEAGLAADAAAAAAVEEHAVVVDNMLTRWLRPHQREGLQFMFECVTGLRLAEGRGEWAVGRVQIVGSIVRN